MADLESYMTTAHKICMNDETIAHLLWADELMLFFWHIAWAANTIKRIKTI